MAGRWDCGRRSPTAARIASHLSAAAPFLSELGDYLPPLELRLTEGRYHRQLANLSQRVHNILDGYVDNEEEVRRGLYVSLFGVLVGLRSTNALVGRDWRPTLLTCSQWAASRMLSTGACTPI